MMEAARTSETSVDNYFTWQYISEHKSELHTRRRENLKSDRVVLVCQVVLIDGSIRATYSVCKCNAVCKLLIQTATECKFT
jgi:hypothetical protein